MEKPTAPPEGGRHYKYQTQREPIGGPAEVPVSDSQPSSPDSVVTLTSHSDGTTFSDGSRYSQ